MYLERWLSGLKRLPAKQESGKPGARVRIPLSPPAIVCVSIAAWQAISIYYLVDGAHASDHRSVIGIVLSIF